MVLPTSGSDGLRPKPRGFLGRRRWRVTRQRPGNVHELGLRLLSLPHGTGTALRRLGHAAPERAASISIPAALLAGSKGLDERARAGGSLEPLNVERGGGCAQQRAVAPLEFLERHPLVRHRCAYGEAVLTELVCDGPHEALGIRPRRGAVRGGLPLALRREQVQRNREQLGDEPPHFLPMELRHVPDAFLTKAMA
eukprot:CAMPEP_0177590492 /NCGR_PEP_ID=MMETSP0419_2-20121207/7438_1 /TAXON_ID=582737 /ORGANISM="Tetraselmis sp., Strain GSL018" /LENGTH=195 /DNA_ID=CAMNT_0019081061 /DNA_START=131 /DNA_END=718 /DNA_ORIENTATION=+